MNLQRQSNTQEARVGLLPQHVRVRATVDVFSSVRSIDFYVIEQLFTIAQSTGR